MSNQPTRLLVLGDPGVGKTSIIHAGVTQCSSDDLPAVIPIDVTIPRELTQGNLNAMQLSDMSSRLEDRESYWFQIARGDFDALVLVFAADDDLSFERLRSYWLPEIALRRDAQTRTLSSEKTGRGGERVQQSGGGARRRRGPLPVVLARNKIDLAVDRVSLEKRVLPIVEEYPDLVVSCVECSAQTVFQIKSVFYYAQKAVIFPLAPLFSARSGELSPGFRAALRRIFRVFDSDHDGLLSDNEMASFQSHCFRYELYEDDIAGMHRVLRLEDPAFVKMMICLSRTPHRSWTMSHCSPFAS